MKWQFNSTAIALALISTSISAQTPPIEIVEESDTYRVYADGSIERKEAAFDQAEGEAMTQAEIESQLQKQATQTSTGATRGMLEENGVPGLWKGFGGVPYGCNGRINAIEKGPDGKTYLAGSFSACNEVIVNNITAWDPNTNTFEALGVPAGVNSDIRDMVFAPNGDLIVVGGFSRAGSVSVNVIARWDGSKWSRVGQDFFSSSINAVAVDPDTGNIHVGGFFTRIFLNGGGELQVNRIAVWDGASWNALGDGFDDSVDALQLVDGILYAGGRFGQSGTLPVNNIAAWNGTAWSDVGGGTDGSVRDLESDGTRLFAGGFFANAGGVATGEIAVWDGTVWSSINGPTCCLGAMDYSAGRLVITGGFSSVNGVSARRVAIWDGANWSATADESAFSGFGSAILGAGTDIYVGGSFSVIGTFFPENFPAEGTFANRIARFDAGAQQWTALGNGQGNNLNERVFEMVEVGDEIWLTGSFSAAGKKLMPNGLARWNGSEWIPAPGNTLPCGSFGDLAVGTAGDVFARTSCFASGGIEWFGSARFDGVDWQPLGDGPFPRNVTVDPVTGDAYYTGSFTETEGDSPIPVNRIARWDGTAWSSVGDGMENGVSNTSSSFSDIDSAAAYNGAVMVEGFFDRAGTVPADRLALWDGSGWMVPGDGLSSGDFSPFITALEGHGSSVFAAGFFDRSGERPLRNISRWDGVAWQPLAGAAGEGTGFTPSAMHATSTDLYVGGSFSEAGGRPARRIARWDGQDWLSLGTGGENGLARADAFFSPINAMQSSKEGIFVGGFFGGSNAVFSPNLIRFVPMENLDLAIDAQVTGIVGNIASYEITITNNGEVTLVDSSLVGNWSPTPLSVNWTCDPVAPATRGCAQDTGSGGLNQILEVPAGATVRFEVTVDADDSASPFLDFEGTWSAAPVEGATGTTEDSVSIQSAISAEAVFKDDFEG